MARHSHDDKPSSRQSGPDEGRARRNAPDARAPRARVERAEAAPGTSSEARPETRSETRPGARRNPKAEKRSRQAEVEPLRLDLNDPEAREIVRQALQHGKLPRGVEKRVSKSADSRGSEPGAGLSLRRSEASRLDERSENPARGPVNTPRRTPPPLQELTRLAPEEDDFEPYGGHPDNPYDRGRRRTQHEGWRPQPPPERQERPEGSRTRGPTVTPASRLATPYAPAQRAGEGPRPGLPPGRNPARVQDVRSHGGPQGGLARGQEAPSPALARGHGPTAGLEVTPQTALPPGGLFTALIPVILESWQECLKGWAPLDKLLADALSSHGLSRGGRGVVVKTIQGMCRHHGQLVGALGRCLFPSESGGEPGLRLQGLEPDTQARLEVAAWAVALEGRTAAQAATLVGLTAPAQLSALEALPKALAEARQVIDRVLQGIHPLDDAMAAEALSLPLWLTRLWAEQRGWVETVKLGLSLLEPPPLTLRVTPHRITRKDMLERLELDHGIEAVATPLSPFGLVLPHRIPLYELPDYKEGLLEVQDEGSQLVAIATGAGPGKRVLDLCAGAGGKILLVASLQRLAGEPGETFACDPHPGRLKELKKRLLRSGVTHVGVRQADALDPHALVDLNGRIDRVIVDAPCSGLGALRRNPEARWRLQPGDLDRFPPLQLKLLQKAASLLRKGGRLIYATCTLNRAENEALLETMTASGLRGAPLCTDFGSLSTLLKLDPEQSRLELLPPVHGTDGFFVGILEKV